MRPDNWENPFTKLLQKAMNLQADNFPYRDVKAEEKAFEAGADAMLEAIWKMAKDSPTGTFTFDTNTINIFGDTE